MLFVYLVGVTRAGPSDDGSSGVQRDGQGGGGAANGAPWPHGGGTITPRRPYNHQIHW